LKVIFQGILIVLQFVFSEIMIEELFIY